MSTLARTACKNFGYRWKVYINDSRMLCTTTQRCAIYNIATDDEFDDKVIRSKKSVVVDFHASWCGPCKVIGPALEKHVKKLSERIDLIKVDIDEAPDIAMEHEVSAVPTLLFVKEGEIVGKSVGLIAEKQLKAKIDELIEN